MARGGINRVQVENAYKAIVIRGENPSIDAIRAEMGNTGSKSTIHRYLKEIQDEKTSEQTEEEKLTKPLKNLITDMVQALRQHASEIVEDNNREYDKRIAHLNERNLELNNDQKSQAKQIEALTRQLNEAVSLAESQKESLNQQDQKTQSLLQTEQTQKALLEEKGAHIASLEQKHQHSREALEHYRTSVKDMRDQDIRTHEAQVQQLQAQIQQLGQTLQVKQSDITLLNKDNGRLAEELKQAQKNTTQQTLENQKLHTNLTKLHAELENVKNSNIAITQQLDTHKDATQKLEVLVTTHNALVIKHQQTHAQNQSFEQTVNDKTQQITQLHTDKQQLMDTLSALSKNNLGNK